MNYFSDNAELQWMFDNAIDWNTLLPLYFPQYPTEDGLTNQAEVQAFLKELTSTVGDWSGTKIAARAEKLDRNGAGIIKDGKVIVGPELTELYREATELAFFGLPLPREHDGLELPAVVYLFMVGMMARGCHASSIQAAFFTCIGAMISRFASPELQKKYVPMIIRGEISGAMCLTEPHCGSDVGAIKTSAAPQIDGTYLINGTKVFITNGGGGINLILARIPGAPAGLEGISLFLAEQVIKDPDTLEEKLNYIVAKNEHKLGLHGSFTCEMVYQNTIAHIIGKPGEGFSIMLHLMNEARIAVGMQSLGNIEATLAYAKGYATDRVQFGKPIAELPLMKRNLDDYTTEQDGLRALVVDTLSYYDIYQRLDYKKSRTNDLTEAEAKLHRSAWMKVRRRTPLVKYYGSEALASISQKCIQVLGGYGFMAEYPVERWHRDSFGPLLYEGTSQIQALMALKDLIKMALKNPQQYFTGLINTLPKQVFNNELDRKLSKTLYSFQSKVGGLLFRTLRPKGQELFNPKTWNPAELKKSLTQEDKIGKLMEHAETICQALSYTETLKVLAAHAKKDPARRDLFDRYRLLVSPRLEMIYSDWSLRSKE